MFYYPNKGGQGFSGSLTYEEALFIIDALNGVVCTPETLLGNIIGWLEYSNVDFPSTLEHKIAQMTLFQRQDLLEKVERFWSISEISNIEERMREVELL